MKNLLFRTSGIAMNCVVNALHCSYVTLIMTSIIVYYNNIIIECSFVNNSVNSLFLDKTNF